MKSWKIPCVDAHLNFRKTILSTNSCRFYIFQFFPSLKHRVIPAYSPASRFLRYFLLHLSKCVERECFVQQSSFSHLSHSVYSFHDARHSFNMMILRAEPGYNPNLKMHLLVFALYTVTQTIVLTIEIRRISCTQWLEYRFSRSCVSVEKNDSLLLLGAV